MSSILDREQRLHLSPVLSELSACFIKTCSMFSMLCNRICTAFDHVLDDYEYIFGVNGNKKGPAVCVVWLCGIPWNHCSKPNRLTVRRWCRHDRARKANSPLLNFGEDKIRLSARLSGAELPAGSGLVWIKISPSLTTAVLDYLKMIKRICSFRYMLMWPCGLTVWFDRVCVRTQEKAYVRFLVQVNLCRSILILCR